MSHLLIDTTQLLAAGYEQRSIDAIVARNEMVQRFFDSPIGSHLRSVENQDITEASGGRLLGAAAIKDEIDEFAPSAFLFPLGYLPVWSSIGGNVVFYGIREAAFFWADHEGFSSDGTMFLFGSLTEKPYDSSNATEGMHRLTDDAPEKFFDDLRAGAYTDRLDALD